MFCDIVSLEFVFKLNNRLQTYIQFGNYTLRFFGRLLQNSAFSVTIWPSQIWRYAQLVNSLAAASNWSSPVCLIAYVYMVDYY